MFKKKVPDLGLDSAIGAIKTLSKMVSDFKLSCQNTHPLCALCILPLQGWVLSPQISTLGENQALGPLREGPFSSLLAH